MKNWATHTEEKIRAKLEGTKDKELRFFRIEELIRNIHRTELYARDCTFCSAHKTEIETVVEKIDEAVHVPGQARREYDRLIGRIASHMQKSHGFYAPYYYSYLYSFFGMTAGLLAGYILMRLLPEFDWVMLSAGFASGLIAGNILGARKDRKVREEKKLM